MPWKKLDDGMHYYKKSDGRMVKDTICIIDDEIHAFSTRGVDITDRLVDLDIKDIESLKSKIQVE